MSNQDLEDVLRAYDQEIRHLIYRVQLFQLMSFVFFASTIALTYFVIAIC